MLFISKFTKRLTKKQNKKLLMKPYIVHLQYLRLNKCKKASNEVTI